MGTFEQGTVRPYFDTCAICQQRVDPTLEKAENYHQKQECILARKCCDEISYFLIFGLRRKKNKEEKREKEIARGKETQES